MPVKPPQRPPICIVGPGRLGAALAINLHRAGWTVERLVVRSGARRSGKTARLPRAARPGGGLQPVRAKGARVAWVHPGMAFVAKSVPALRGVPFGVEGDAAALRLARKIIARLGGLGGTVRQREKK